MHRSITTPHLWAFLACALVAATPSAQAQVTLSAQDAPAITSPADLPFHRIFDEPFLPGVRPSLRAISPDAQQIYFTWNDSANAGRKTFVVDPKGAVVDTVGTDATLSYRLSPDRSQVMYVEDQAVFLASSTMENHRFKNPEQIIASKGRLPLPQWSPDGSMIAWAQDEDIWVMTMGNRSVQKVLDNDSADGQSFAGWASNEHLLLVSRDNSDTRLVYFPEYVDTFVEPGESRRGVYTTTYSVMHLDSTSSTEVLRSKGWVSTQVSPTGSYLALDAVDAPMKKRQIHVWASASEQSTIVFEDSTEGWMYGRNMAFAPSKDVLMFQSEQSGWNHIYTVSPDGSGLKQHTTGSYDIPFAEWVDDETIVMATTQKDLGERQVALLDLRDASTETLTEAEGYRYQFRLSPDKRHLLYAYTTFNQPYDLYRLDLRRPRGEIQLTQTVPEAFTQIDWQTEQYVRFTGRDGETGLSMSILTPEDYQPGSGKQYPTVVFVHGAGSLQNVFKGFSNSYYREYMFHQWLTSRGYVVVEVDYRHSTGYGRKFREDVTNWMGKYETEDIIDGLDWIAENGDYVDRDRVGIYGGSYGGFMALYAATVEPDHFHAAAALRAVTNWRNYYYANPWYTLPRLGTPEDNPVHYERSSPLDLVDDLERPVLILHGLVDDNVGFQDAAQYIEALIQAGDKEFDMMMYPSEPHGFQDPDSWIDEYERIFEFFEENL